jgi:NAD(P)-dependent dehydrogenase (short-subunit alcohol dehydrogenase family)
MEAADRVWFITGAATGLGRALSDHVLAAGERVIATARGVDRLADVATAGPRRARTLELDITDADAVRSVVAEAWTAFGRVDYVVNNAGSAYRAPLEACSDDNVRALFETNFFGAVSVIQEFVPRLRAQGSGHIVNISSLAGGAAVPGRSVYAATKFALEGLSVTMAHELAMFGIKMTVIQPGGFATELLKRAAVLPVLEDYRPLYDLMSHHATGTAPSDPALGAVAIYDAVTSPDPPLRLPLNGSCLDMLRRATRDQLAEYDKWEATSRSTDPASA